MARATRTGACVLRWGVDDPALVRGFHDADFDEGRHWTDGDAVLPVERLPPEISRNVGVLTVRVRAVPLAGYPDDGVAVRRVA
jgi:hypothetical protein